MIIGVSVRNLYIFIRSKEFHSLHIPAAYAFFRRRCNGSNMQLHSLLSYEHGRLPKFCEWRVICSLSFQICHAKIHAKELDERGCSAGVSDSEKLNAYDGMYYTTTWRSWVGGYRVMVGFKILWFSLQNTLLIYLLLIMTYSPTWYPQL